MILLPEWPAPSGASPSLIDFGMVLRPATGARVHRLNRKGNRWRLLVSYPPMRPAVSQVFISRLAQAKTRGLRMPFPLLIAQGPAGMPEVAGAGQAGTSLAVRGLTRGYVAQEGFWLSIEDETGRHYLHQLRAPARADAAGNAVMPITPDLRTPFADGARVHLSKPMVDGFVDGEEWGWAIPVNRLIALEFPLEEWG